MAFGGEIRLHLLGDVTLDTGVDPTGKNIAWIGGPALRPAGSTVRFLHDSLRQLWYEVA